MPTLPRHSLRAASGFLSRLLVPALLGVVSASAQVQSIPVVDSAFQPHPGARAPLAVQSDGKLVVTGDGFLIGGVTQKGVARLNADGSLDTSFATGTGTDASGVKTVVVQTDKKILIGGSFANFSGANASGLIRLLATGAVDTAFTYDGPGTVLRVAPLASGGYLVADGGPQVRVHDATGATVRLLPKPVTLVPNSSGSLGADRFADGDVHALEVAELKDGTLLGVYQILDTNGSASPNQHQYWIAVYAYDATGILRGTWPDIKPVGPTAVGGPINPPARADHIRLLPLASGGFYVLGSGAYYQQPPTLRRYLADGTPDPAFTSPTLATARVQGYDALSGGFDSSGNLVVAGGAFPEPAFATTWAAVRLLDNGALDPKFGLAYPAGTDATISGPGFTFGGVRAGSTAADDRLIIQAGNTLKAYKLVNEARLGASSQLPSSQSATTGRSVTLRANQAGTDIRWQVSTNGNTWTDLTDDGIYRGTHTDTLEIASPTSAQNNLQYRFVGNTLRGAVVSNATTLHVAALLFPYPASIAADSSGNLFVGDTSLHTIQRITSGGQVMLLAGSAGNTGTADGTGSAARFNQPGGLASSPAGELTVADSANGSLRRISSTGVVTTFAGASAAHGSTDGSPATARFSAPVGVARTASGTFFVADSTNHTIRLVLADGTVSTFAGQAGVSGATDGTGSSARFNSPTGVAVDADGTVYVADTTNNLIRKITSGGVVTTLAGVSGVSGTTDGMGSGALFNRPGGLAVDATGNLYVADTGNSVVRKITPGGTVTTVAGLPSIGGLKDGTGGDAWFNQPLALGFAADGNLYVADTGNAAIRKITPAGAVTTLELGVSASTAPSITTQPASATVVAGSAASFSVTASGDAPLAYQWRKDGTNIAGATSSGYSIASATSAQAGTYSVVVSNNAGSVTSSGATLTVTTGTTPPPSNSGNGGGGGGAPSWWFAGVLGGLGLLRRLLPARKLTNGL